MFFPPSLFLRFFFVVSNFTMTCTGMFYTHLAYGLSLLNIWVEFLSVLVNSRPLFWILLLFILSFPILGFWWRVRHVSVCTCLWYWWFCLLVSSPFLSLCFCLHVLCWYTLRSITSTFCRVQSAFRPTHCFYLQTVNILALEYHFNRH